MKKQYSIAALRVVCAVSLGLFASSNMHAMQGNLTRDDQAFLTSNIEGSSSREEISEQLAHQSRANIDSIKKTIEAFNTAEKNKQLEGMDAAANQAPLLTNRMEALQDWFGYRIKDQKRRQEYEATEAERKRKEEIEHKAQEEAQKAAEKKRQDEAERKAEELRKQQEREAAEHKAQEEADARQKALKEEARKSQEREKALELERQKEAERKAKEETEAKKKAQEEALKIEELRKRQEREAAERKAQEEAEARKKALEEEARKTPEAKARQAAQEMDLDILIKNIEQDFPKLENYMRNTDFPTLQRISINMQVLKERLSPTGYKKIFDENSKIIMNEIKAYLGKYKDAVASDDKKTNFAIARMLGEKLTSFMPDQDQKKLSDELAIMYKTAESNELKGKINYNIEIFKVKDIWSKESDIDKLNLVAQNMMLLKKLDQQQSEQIFNKDIHSNVLKKINGYLNDYIRTDVADYQKKYFEHAKTLGQILTSFAPDQKQLNDELEKLYRIAQLKVEFKSMGKVDSLAQQFESFQQISKDMVELKKRIPQEEYKNFFNEQYQSLLNVVKKQLGRGYIHGVDQEASKLMDRATSMGTLLKNFAPDSKILSSELDSLYAAAREERRQENLSSDEKEAERKVKERKAQGEAREREKAREEEKSKTERESRERERAKKEREAEQERDAREREQAKKKPDTQEARKAREREIEVQLDLDLAIASEFQARVQSKDQSGIDTSKKRITSSENSLQQQLRQLTEARFTQVFLNWYTQYVNALGAVKKGLEATVESEKLSRADTMRRLEGIAKVESQIRNLQKKVDNAIAYELTDLTNKERAKKAIEQYSRETDSVIREVKNLKGLDKYADTAEMLREAIMKSFEEALKKASV